MRYLKTGVFALLIVTLTACGFRLNTRGTLPPMYHRLYLTGSRPYSYFIKMLSGILEGQNVTLVTSAKHAPLTLNIATEALSYSQTSVGSSQQTRQYQITYSVNFNLQSPKGKVIAGPFVISQSMNQTMFANQLIENTQQLTEDKRQLEQLVMNQLFYRLAAKNTVKTVRVYLSKRK